MGRYRRKIAIALALAACVVAILIITRPRDEITDPAVLAKMPLGELRDTETETLMRAAFRNAKRAIVHGWGPRGGQELVIVDRSTLDELADNFAAGRDVGQLKPFFCPKLTYTNVKFEGPYTPDFEFADEQRIFIYQGKQMYVRVQFARKIADLLGLDDRLRES